MIFKRIAVFFGCMILSMPFYAQTVRQSYTLKWYPPQYEKISDDIVKSYLFFEGASLYQGEKPTPFFRCSFPLDNGNISANVRIENPVWQPMTAEEIQLVDKNNLSDTLSLKVYTEYTRKVPALNVEFFPFRQSGGNQYEKLISFQLQGSWSINPSPRTHKSRTYVSNSVLHRSGFYKVAVSQTGVHKVTYADFVALGINMSALRTADIAVFGNGGRMLPESTSEPVFDDLPEIAIQIVDNNGNGVFEQDDYLLFYAVGVVNWNYVPSSNPPFAHELNLYTTNTCYFISINADAGVKKRIGTLPSLSSGATHTVNTYHYYNVYEKDLVNVYEVSRIWLGEEFNIQQSYEFPFAVPGISRTQNASLRIQTALKSSVASAFSITANGQSLPVAGFSAAYNLTLMSPFVRTFLPANDNINIGLSYNKPTGSSLGWLNYIELHATRSLAQHTAMISFRNPEVVGNGNIADYRFETQGKNTQIWDVTDQHNVKKINGTKNGNTLSFMLSADSLREFIAFDGSSFHSVTPMGRVDPQNLHGLSNLDFIIITHPDFLGAANQLADFRRRNDNMRVQVVTTTQVYNEFSSGACDIGAIRNFLKMFYDRETAVNMPKNVLLLGGTSYDPRNIMGSNSCFIPNYQGATYIYDHTGSLSTDNFFTKLADGKGTPEGDGKVISGSMDMGLGRFPVTSNAQAMILVDKSIRYASYENLVEPNSKYVSNLGNWRNIIAFLTDDKDGAGFHLENAEAVAAVAAPNRYLNIEKIYCDAYKKESSSQGARFTDATRAMNNRIDKGCLMFTYFGHGGDNGWAHERLYLPTRDLRLWNNKYCLPFFYTACCTFGRYDKLTSTSPAEDILLKPDGGAIALITSTRDSYSASNQSFGERIYARAFEQTNQQYLTLGEINAKAQADSKNEMFVLLGDPSLTLAHPKHKVITDSIDGISVTVFQDTIRALQFVTISGYVADQNNVPLTNFNGWVYSSVYDKSDSVSTINPNLEDVKKFPLQKSIIFKGKSNVRNGRFSFSFMTPKDINYEYGLGKISYYATGDKTDAKGYSEMIIGGMNDTVIDDKQGPEISLYFNDEKFVQGGITTPAPVLYAKISDESGINTTGAGIGHDITAIIDGNTSDNIVLNDFFEYDTNSYKSGSLSYALSTLPEGKHSLTLRAWDVVNNMGEAVIDFEVVNETEIQIKHVLNYPNPFTTSTLFFFEHNRPNTPLQITIQIFTISGKLVRTITQLQQTTGFRSDPVPWNGRDEFEDKLARGIYIYRLQVLTPDGKSAEKIEKIAIL
ncbi:MAG: type IX secretion system sortase PorU [Bacteroidales bacterium]|jgi:hypothetical protein|nr:type IX secretion system sortase PorU [Bacteroidales bacterium]